MRHATAVPVLDTGKFTKAPCQGWGRRQSLADLHIRYTLHRKLGELHAVTQREGGKKTATVGNPAVTAKATSSHDTDLSIFILYKG
jgi:hypothetical protein